MTSTAESFLDPQLRRALNYVAKDADDPERAKAAKIFVLSSAGYADMEIAKKVELSWRKMNQTRLTMQGGLIEVMRADGASDPEIRRTLRITEGAFASAIGAVAPTYD
jgi:hypothetical protein